jgi:hypothetical protein
MKQPFLTCMTMLIIIFTASCGKVALSLFQSNNTAFKEDPSSPLIDIEQRCGASKADLLDPNYIILSADFKSLPINSSGEKDGISYTVQLRATTHIDSRSKLNQTDTTVVVESLSGKDASGVVLSASAADKVIRPDAENNAKDSTGSVYGSSTTGATILRLAREDNSPYKNMLCAVGFIDSQRDGRGGGTTGEVRFDQPLPISLNPKAASTTYDLELGANRVFQLNAKILTTKTGWVQNTTFVPVQVTWNKVSTDIKQSSQVTGQDLPVIKADVAYEVTIATTGTQPYMIGLSRRRVFYVDTSTHQFTAIIDDSGKIQNGTTDKVLPPTVLLPQ